MTTEHPDCVKFQLYVAGATPNSLQALANIKTIQLMHFPDSELEIIDVFQSPERAARYSILLTPTLLKVAPQPACKIVGTLSDREHVLWALGVVKESHGH